MKGHFWLSFWAPLLLGILACSSSQNPGGTGEQREGAYVVYLPQDQPGWESTLFFERAEVIARDRRAECYREVRRPVERAEMDRGEALFASGATWLESARTVDDEFVESSPSSPANGSTVPLGGTESKSSPDREPVVSQVPSMQFATPCGEEIGAPSTELRSSSVVTVVEAHSGWVPATTYNLTGPHDDPAAMELVTFLDQLFPKDW
jgi:hypothetical protein